MLVGRCFADGATSHDERLSHELEKTATGSGSENFRQKDCKSEHDHVKVRLPQLSP